MKTKLSGKLPTLVLALVGVLSVLAQAEATTVTLGLGNQTLYVVGDIPTTEFGSFILGGVNLPNPTTCPANSMCQYVVAGNTQVVTGLMSFPNLVKTFETTSNGVTCVSGLPACLSDENLPGEFAIDDLHRTLVISGQYFTVTSYPGSSVDGVALILTLPGSLTLSLTPPTPTPLPAALPLFATGLGALGLLARRRKRKQAA